MKNVTAAMGPPVFDALSAQIPVVRPLVSSPLQLEAADLTGLAPAGKAQISLPIVATTPWTVIQKHSGPVNDVQQAFLEKYHWLPPGIFDTALGILGRSIPVTDKDQESEIRKAIATVLQTKTVEPRVLGGGSYYDVYRLSGMGPWVVKRLKAKRQPMLQQGGRTIAEHFRWIEQQHLLVKHYFGPEFVPRSIFVPNVETDFGLPDHEVFLARNEYVLLQQEIFGENIFAIEHVENRTISPEFKEKLRRFIRCYRAMMRQEMMTIEDQVFIDLEKETIFCSDTNNLKDFFPHYIDNNQFLRNFNVDPAFTENSRFVLDVLVEHIPELGHFRGRSFAEVHRELYFGVKSKLYMELFDIMETRSSKAVAMGFKALIEAISYFPAEGDNVFIREMIEKFDLGDF